MFYFIPVPADGNAAFHFSVRGLYKPQLDFAFRHSLSHFPFSLSSLFSLSLSRHGSPALFYTG